MKPERYVRRVAWVENARQAGLRWRSFAELIGFTALVVAVLTSIPHLPFRGAAIGFCVGVALTFVAVSVARFDDPVVRGDLAEQWTIETLGKVPGWLVTSGPSFPDGDLDHLVVTSSGVLAVETKYRFRQPSPERVAEQRRRDHRSAQRAGRKTASLLRSKQVGVPATVTPVLMTWGPGKPDLPDGYRLVTDAAADVYVVDGGQPSLWTGLFAAPPLLPTEAREKIHASLAHYRRRQTDLASNPRTHCLGRCGNSSG